MNDASFPEFLVHSPFFHGYCVNRAVISGTIPMLGQVMSATRGATNAFSGVSKHVNGAVS